MAGRALKRGVDPPGDESRSQDDEEQPGHEGQRQGDFGPFEERLLQFHRPTLGLESRSRRHHHRRDRHDEVH